MQKRLRVDTRDVVAPILPTNTTMPATPPGASSGTATATISPRSPHSNASRSNLPPQEKVNLILQRHSHSFCEQLGIDLVRGKAEALWQWFCASVLISSRIKSNAGITASQALLEAGFTSAENTTRLSKLECMRVLRENGFERYDDKTAEFILEDAKSILADYGGDLNGLREAAGKVPAAERALLKKYRGVGDGGVDIFFREVQLIWPELFPFADKKALKAARLVGLREHPETLAALCGNEPSRYVRLIDALVRIELSKSHKEF